MNPRVLNVRDSGERGAPAIYIGRPSPFGNPFVIGRDGTREQVVAQFERWLMSQPELVERVKRELAGRNLVCYCAPLPCHGDVLLRVANE